MNIVEHNREAWNKESREGGTWSLPASPELIAEARTGHPTVVLTPKKPVPQEWLGALQGAKVLCLASAGGQQVPILAAAGAQVTSYDLSEEQLARDREVTLRENLSVRLMQGRMTDLAPFGDDSFDLIFHPVSNVFIPQLEPLWRECFRVLRPGGRLLAGFMNPALFLFDHDEADASGVLTVKYTLPFASPTSLSPEQLAAAVEKKQTMTFSHSLEAQIGGQLAQGFQITGLYEDGSEDASWVYARHTPVAVATMAIKPR